MIKLEIDVIIFGHGETGRRAGFRPLMAVKLRKMAKSPALLPPPRRGGGNSTMLFRFIRVRALMAAKLRKTEKSPVLCSPPGGGRKQHNAFPVYPG